jgi:FkbM family methyltransferase
VARVTPSLDVRRRVSVLARRSATGRALTQAARVTDPVGFLRAERAGRSDAAAEYALRSGDARVALRHGTTDVRMFDEIFCAHVYAPPAAATARLSALPGPPRVLDLGANVGLFSADAAARWPGARITAVEPDPANLTVLRRCAELNAHTHPWRVIPTAASTSATPLRFVAGEGSESHEAHASELEESIEVPATDALALLDDTDLAKIDIEGGEWAILGDPRLAGASVRAIVLEHHGRLCPSRDPRATARTLLGEAGFETLAGGAAPLGVGTLWAWRP